MLSTLLPILTALLALPFAVLVVVRWRSKHRPYLLLWAIGIITYGLGAAAEGVFKVVGWQPLLFRIFYLCGAILTAAWLGQGTLQLLGKRPWPQISLALLTVLSLGGVFEVSRAALEPTFMSDRVGTVEGLNGVSADAALQLAATAVQPAAGAVSDVWARAVAVRGGLTTPAATPPERLAWGLRRGDVAVGTAQMLEDLGIRSMANAPATGTLWVTQGARVVGRITLLPPTELNGSAIIRTTSNARTITPFFNVYGTLGLAGGAIYSAYLFFRKGVLFHRMVGNILIAVGALSPALGGTLSKAGFPYAVQVSNLIGIIIIFVGFLQATRAD